MSDLTGRGRYRLTTRSITRARTLTLENEEKSWPEIHFLLRETPKLCLRTARPSYHIQFLPEIISLMLTRKLRPGIAQLRPLVRASRASVLVATDGGHREHLKAISELCPEIPLLVIAHGSVRTDVLCQTGALPSLNGGCFLVWGQADISCYNANFGQTQNLLAVGSLRNSFYWRHFRSGQPAPLKKFPISLVSQFADYKEEDNDRPNRTRVLRNLKFHLARFCRDQRLPMRILLRPGLSGEMVAGARQREIRHYLKVFAGVEVSFSDPTRQYETYFESDQSEVTVGVPTGALIESFARGNKVLMFAQNPDTGDYFGSPVTGAFLCHEPTYEDFKYQLQYLLAQGQSEFADSFRSEREFVMADACSDVGITTVEAELKRLQQL